MLFKKEEYDVSFEIPAKNLEIFFLNKWKFTCNV